MVLYPGILAILLVSFSVLLMALLASVTGVRILRGWDLRSGSELQLQLERRTYLVSTLLAHAFTLEILSFFYFVFIADRIHPLFHGAMCAAGSLNANSYGYPALIAKMLVFFLCGTWLIINRADNSGIDYPLIKTKYRLLISLFPVMVAEAYLQFSYFQSLSPDVITSCCGSLFGGSAATQSDTGLRTELSVRTVFFIMTIATFLAGLFVLRSSGRGTLLFAVLSAVLFVISLYSLISVFSLYVYELPTHHCPFCLLQREYHHIGYALYIPMFAGAVTGIGAGILHRFRTIASLRETLPALQHRLVFVSVICTGIYLALILAIIATSNLRLVP
jgi:hypothetical protein